MFNLFKNTQEVTPEVPKISKTIDSKVIRGTIDDYLFELINGVSKADSIKNEIEEIKKKKKDFLKKNKELTAKVASLKKFGFNNTPSVTSKIKELENMIAQYDADVKVLDDKLTYSLKVHNYTEGYSTEFPGYKFVDDKTMLRVMKEYNLYCGIPYFYSKEIPQEALDNMEKVSSKVESQTLYLYTDTYGNVSMSFKGIPANAVDFSSGLSVRHYPPTQHKILREIPHSNLRIIAPSNHFGCDLTEDFKEAINFSSIHVMGWGRESKINAKNSLVFNEDTRTVSINFKALNQEMSKHRVKDPIASLKVDGGYIILHAWDEEANIPEIINPKLN